MEVEAPKNKESKDTDVEMTPDPTFKSVSAIKSLIGDFLIEGTQTKEYHF